KAEPYLKKAVELRQKADGPEHENVAQALVSYAWVLQNDDRYVEAEDHLQRALEIYRRRNVTGRPVINALSALQKGLFKFGRDAEAERVMGEAKTIADSSGEGQYDVAAMLHRYARRKIDQGKFAEGEKLARQSIDMQRGLPSSQGLNGAWGLLTLSNALQSQ